MKTIFYRILSGLTRCLGPWFFSLVSAAIAIGYFLLFPRRVAVGMHFYRHLWPGRSRLYYRWCTLRQFVDFTHVFRDRLMLSHNQRLTTAFEGLAHLEKAVKSGGGILLMSHVGNWEVAARLLKRSLPGLNLMLFMGVKQKEQIEGLQKQSVRQEDIRIVGVDPSGGSPFDIVEAIRFIRGGGLVSITGDRMWQNDQRRLAVRFLGQRAYLPAAPYTLAMAAGCPLFVFFALRTGPCRYLFHASAPITISAVERSQRDAAMTAAAQDYADRLEAAVRQHPFQWHHFEPFINHDVTL